MHTIVLGHFRSFSKEHSLLIKIAVSLAIVIILGLQIDAESLRNTLHQIKLEAWLVALGFIFVQIFTLSYRWMLLVNAQKQKMNYIAALKITLASTIANYILITTVGGVIVRVALAMKHGVSLVHAVAAATLDRLMTVLALLVLSVVFLPILYGIVETEIYHSTLVTIAALFMGFGGIALLFLKHVQRGLIFSHRKMAVGFKYLRAIGSDHKTLFKICVTSLIAQVAYFAAVYAVMASTGVSVSWLHFMSVMPMIAIVSSLPIGYGGWGIREGAFVYGLGLINIPLDIAFVVSVQIGLIGMLAALIAWGFSFFDADVVSRLRADGK